MSINLGIKGNSLIGSDRKGRVVFTITVAKGILAYKAEKAEKEIPLDKIDVIVMKRGGFPIRDTIDFLTKWPDNKFGRIGSFEVGCDKKERGDLFAYLGNLLIKEGLDALVARNTKTDEIDVEIIREKKSEVKDAGKIESLYLELRKANKSDSQICDILWKDGFTMGDINYVAKLISEKEARNSPTIEEMAEDADRKYQEELKATRKIRLVKRIAYTLITLAILAYILYSFAQDFIGMEQRNNEFNAYMAGSR